MQVSLIVDSLNLFACWYYHMCSSSSPQLVVCNEGTHRSLYTKKSLVLYFFHMLLVVVVLSGVVAVHVLGKYANKEGR